MNQKYTKNLPQWYKNSERSYDTVLSDDIDGLVTTSILHSVMPNWKVGYFYDFDNLYCKDEIFAKQDKSHTRVWCDVSILYNEMAFDNHVARINNNDFCNSKVINPNIMADVTSQNYTSKYCGSTALMVWSLYGLPLPETELGKMILLAIDATYKGYYYSGGLYRDRNRFFLCDVLEFPELYELEERHTEQEFRQLIARYHLSCNTIYNAPTAQIITPLPLAEIGKQLNLNLLLPEDRFTEYVSFAQETINITEYHSVKQIHPRIATLAMIYRKVAKYSYWL